MRNHKLLEGRHSFAREWQACCSLPWLPEEGSRLRLNDLACDFSHAPVSCLDGNTRPLKRDDMEPTSFTGVSNGYPKPKKACSRPLGVHEGLPSTFLADGMTTLVKECLQKSSHIFPLPPPSPRAGSRLRSLSLRRLVSLVLCCGLAVALSTEETKHL